MTRPTTLGELRASGYRPRTVKQELRANLVARLERGEPVFPGIVGYDRTVIPQVQNALLAGHDFLLLGLRGQAKTRLLRALPSLLDEAVPAIAGTPLREDPLRPVTELGRRLVAERGDDLPLAWIGREERYREKLATPDVTIADLIGDVDPIKAASRRLALDDPEVVHPGILPRSNRGIFAINELPDLQARIQVGLLNVLEEGDVQIRGFPLRIPLDVLLVFSANPEDYTNRGNIITPLRDRIASQILTHYPRTVADSLAITDQEAWRERGGTVEVLLPEWLRLAVEEVAFQARASELVDQSSGVSARMTIALLENVVSNAERRGLLCGERRVVARVADLFTAIPAITGKLELVFEGEREGPRNVALALVGKALQAVFDARVPEQPAPERPARRSASPAEPAVPAAPDPFAPIVAWFGGGRSVDLADDLGAAELATRLEPIPGLAETARAVLGGEEPPEHAAAMECVLEALHQRGLVAKEELAHGRVYRDAFEEMVKGFHA